MARMPYFDAASGDEETREYLDRLPPMNIFRMMAHAETVMPRFVRMGNALLGKTELDPQLREMAIVRVGHLSQATYELHQHNALCRKLGMPEDKIEALAGKADAPVFSKLERMVLEFADTVVRDVRAPDAMFEALRKELGERQMVELVLTIGYYMMTCRFLENFGVDIEASGDTINP